jgi:two-component system cell cycle sensor histidine kinase/response regulator CckA
LNGEGHHDTKVLLIDDSDMDAMLFCELLSNSRRRRFDITWVADGIHAISVLQARCFDVAVVDYRLGDETGIEVLGRLRRQGWHLPAVMLTGCSESDGFDEEALRAGFVDYVSKSHRSVDVLERTLSFAVERHRAQWKVRLLEQAVATSGQGVAVFDGKLSNGTIDLMNATARRIIGCGGDGGAEFWKCMEWSPQWDEAERVLEAGQTFSFVQRIRERPDQYISWAMSPFQSDDGRPKILAVLADETERHRLHAEIEHLQVSEAIACLAGGLAHDFNNLLTILQGHLNILEGNPELSAGTRQNLAQMADACARAALITRELVTFSDRTVTLVKPLEACETIRRMAPTLVSILGSEISFVLEGAKESCDIEADANMLEQALAALIMNARDALPRPNQVEVRVKVVELASTLACTNGALDPGAYVLIEVEDNGSGIAPQALGQLFEPCFTTKEGSRGLGLKVVRSILAKHGGGILVESEVGRGTVVRMYWKRKTIAEPALPEVVTAQTAQARQRPAKVLLVEDETPLRRMMEALLRREGYEVHGAGQAAEAIETFKKISGDIDLLITDMKLPGHMGGRALAEDLLAQKPDLRIIFISGFSPDLLDRAFVEKHGDQFLPKPFKLAQLSEAVRQQLAGALYEGAKIGL